VGAPFRRRMHPSGSSWDVCLPGDEGNAAERLLGRDGVGGWRGLTSLSCRLDGPLTITPYLSASPSAKTAPEGAHSGFG